MSEYYEKHTGGIRLPKKKVVGAFLILAGIGIFLYFLFPLLSYQLFIADAYEGKKLEAPIPKDMVMDRGTGIGDLLASGISSLTTNYHDARNWYPKIKSETLEKAKVDSYSIAIPKIGLDNAQVSTRDYDLDKHAVQYFGTAIPGEDGTAIVFGHSTIPSWFDPKNYKTIFARLHTIKVGDEIFATVDGIEYRYKIFSIVITSPTDTNILSQNFDNSYITLVTCTPPGTIWKRLIVRAVLTGLDDKI